ncbi:MAG: sulfatase-like hydrolase/transferase [Planctomycetota bacterium]
MTTPHTPSPTHQRDAAVRRHAVSLLWMANFLFGVCLGTNWLVHLPELDRWSVHLFALAALATSVFALTLVPGLLFTALAQVWRSRVVFGALQAIGWAVFHVLLYADTRIYNMFRYHFNGQVLNLVYVRGSEDAIHLGWQVWTPIWIGLALTTASIYWIWTRALARAERVADRPPRAGWRPRWAFVWAAVLLPALCVEKAIYAQAHYEQDHTITALARLFPLYARVPAKDLANAVLGDEPRSPRVELGGLTLDYPHARPSLPPDGARPNMLVAVIDCWRQDMWNSATTPRLFAWGQDARRFSDHASGGNSTRYGLFSMFYGLHGSYWFPVLEAKQPPVFIDALLEAGYDVGVFSATSQNYPELRQTVWSRAPERVHDEFGDGPPWQRDVLAGEALVDWLARRDRARPFFAFLLLDSPHQTYSHPPDGVVFEPSAPAMDYIVMTQNAGPNTAELLAIKNRYQNAVHHADSVVGNVLDALDRYELTDDTLVFVTGDHGEEFRECGFLGHTCAFTHEQVAVPFLVKGPGVEPGLETRATSHLDFAPGVLELLGADPALRPDWCLGEDLFDPPLDRRRVIAGWDELGVWTPNGILRVPLAFFEFDVEVYDRRWNLVADPQAAIQAEAKTLVQLGLDCNRFLR